LKLVKITPKQTVRQCIDELLKEFTEEELSSTAENVIIMYHNTGDDIGYQRKVKNMPGFVGLVECVKSLHLEAWHDRDREVIFYD